MQFNVGDLVMVTKKGVDGARVDVNTVYKVNCIDSGVYQLIPQNDPITKDLNSPTWVTEESLVPASFVDYRGILNDLLSDLGALKVYDRERDNHLPRDLVSHADLADLIAMCRSILKSQKEN